MSDTRQPLPPYLPYKSFVTFLDHLHAIGMPSHIDKSAMTTMSGAMQSWMRATLRYLKLVDDDDKSSERLAKLVKARGEERKPLLRDLFRSSYAFLDGKVDLKNTTPTKLREAIIAIGAQGETVEKITAFLVAFAKDTDTPISPLLTKRAPRIRKPRKSAGAKNTDTPGTNGGHDSGPGSADAAIKTVTLPNAGGSITLRSDINVFSLVGKERDLVFKLIDALNALEKELKGGKNDA